MTQIDAAWVVAAGSRMLARDLTLQRVLTGGQHAVSVLVTDGTTPYVVRAFPRSDLAVDREVRVLGQIAVLGDLVPHLVAHGAESGFPVIVTSALPGSHPAPALPLPAIAEQMAVALAGIHRLDGSMLGELTFEPPAGSGRLDLSARDGLRKLDLSERVLTHSDFWCGNALWDGAKLVGVVDWSGARHAPRGVDVAWCRQDLVLLGSTRAADHFLREYEQHSGTAVADIRSWDLLAAVRAEPLVETWDVNYHGVNRTDLTACMLRRRFDDWVNTLVA